MIAPGPIPTNQPRLQPRLTDTLFRRLAKTPQPTPQDYWSVLVYSPEMLRQAKLDRFAFYRAWRKTTFAKRWSLSIVLQLGATGRPLLSFSLKDFSK